MLNNQSNFASIHKKFTLTLTEVIYLFFFLKFNLKFRHAHFLFPFFLPLFY